MTGRKYCLSYIADWVSSLFLNDPNEFSRVYLELVKNLTPSDYYEDVWVVNIISDLGTCKDTKDLAITYIPAMRILKKVCLSLDRDGMPLQLPQTKCKVLGHAVVKKKLPLNMAQIVVNLLTNKDRPKYYSFLEKNKNVLKIIQFNGRENSKSNGNVSSRVKNEIYETPFDLAKFVKMQHGFIALDHKLGIEVSQCFQSLKFNGILELEIPTDEFPKQLGIVIDFMKEVVKRWETILLDLSDPFPHLSMLLSMAAALGRRKELEDILDSGLVFTEPKCPKESGASSFKNVIDKVSLHELPMMNSSDGSFASSFAEIG